MMLSNTNEFKIFGDGTDRLIMAIGGQAFIFKNAFMNTMSCSSQREQIDVTDMYELSNGGYRQFISGPQMNQVDFSLSCPEIEIIENADIEKLINPLMNKSVLQLMQIVNNKLKERK